MASTQSKNKPVAKHWTEITAKNTKDIQCIKHDITTIKDNHLHHLSKDMTKQGEQIDKIDSRIWWVLSILIATLLTGFIGQSIPFIRAGLGL